MFYINFYSIFIFFRRIPHMQRLRSSFSMSSATSVTPAEETTFWVSIRVDACLCVFLCLIPWIRDKRHLLQESLKKLLDVHMKCESGDKGKYQR